jgi:hypothetical protein
MIAQPRSARAIKQRGPMTATGMTWLDPDWSSRHRTWPLNFS